jgi:hypothetical protein
MHQPLKICRAIRQSKRQSIKLIVPEQDSKARSFFVFFFNINLPEAPVAVQGRKLSAAK